MNHLSFALVIVLALYIGQPSLHVILLWAVMWIWILVISHGICFVLQKGLTIAYSCEQTYIVL